MKVDQLLSADVVAKPPVVPIITWKCAVDTIKKTVVTPIGSYVVIYRDSQDSKTRVTQGVYWNHRDDPYIGKDDEEGEGFSFDRFYFDGYEDPDKKIVLCVVDEVIFERFIVQPKVQLQLMRMC